MTQFDKGQIAWTMFLESQKWGRNELHTEQEEVHAGCVCKTRINS